MDNPVSPDELRRALTSAGAAAVGFAPLGEVEPEAWGEFNRWLAAGNNAGMAYMANHSEIRRNPALLLDPAPEEGTVISLAFRYPSAPDYRPGALRFARYALGDDYHEVLRERLQSVCRQLNEAGWRTRICVDSAPMLERYWAVRAGLGFIGRNRQLIIPGLGSYLFLAEIVTDLVLPPSPRCTASCPPDCTACLRACPHKALSATALDGNEVAGAGLDARRCLSYQTIENRSEELPFPLPRLRPYGCDLCQEACPFNREDTPASIEDAVPEYSENITEASGAVLPELQPRPELLELTPGEAATLDQAAFSRLFRHSAVKRAKLAGLLRNLRHLKD